MKKSAYSPCGLYCGACGEPECEGCLSDVLQEWGHRCPFRKCAREKEVNFCCYCRDYPCKELHAFMHDEWPHHWAMEPNLEYIKHHGLEKWLEAQARGWSCVQCGAGITWYQKVCRCGQKLEAWSLPPDFQGSDQLS